MWELWPFVYFTNFQRRQIQARNQHFSGEKKPTVAWVKISEKNKQKHFFRQANRKKLILPLERYFKTLTDMIICTAST